MVGSASFGLGLVQQRWFTAAVLFPRKIAVEMFPLKPLAATLAIWRAEELSTSVAARHRHFTWEADSFSIATFVTSVTHTLPLNGNQVSTP
jgi:hypothetical protein